MSQTNPNGALKLSWTAMQSYLSCQRKYGLNYVEGLKRKANSEQRNLIIGSAFHYGMERLLSRVWYFQQNELGISMHDMEVAVRSDVRAWFARNHSNNPVKMTYDWELRRQVPDTAYAAMITAAEHTVLAMVSYYVPRLDFDRYKVVSRDVVLANEPHEPFVEYKFELPLSDESVIGGNPTPSVVLIGVIDALLYDTEADEYVLVDWKTRETVPDDFLAALDGQLYLYGAVLYSMGVPVRRVRMWQFRTITPKPAKLNKNGTPSVAAVDTTKEVWVASLPPEIDAKFYLPEMEDKFHPSTDYERIVEGDMTETTAKFALDNAQQVALSITVALNQQSFPALYSSHGCKSCDYKNLCAIPFRHGASEEVMNQMVEQYYDRFAPDEVVEGDVKPE